MQNLSVNVICSVVVEKSAEVICYLCSGCLLAELLLVSPSGTALFIFNLVVPVPS